MASWRRAEDPDAAEAVPAAGVLAGLRSGELARLAGVSKDTLRFYERRGLLEPPRRTSNNYRLFPGEAVERLRWIRSALAMGFTVEELCQITGARSRGQFPCHEVRSLAAAKLAIIEQRLREMKSFRDALRGLLADWAERLEATAPGQPARLLDDLAARAEPLAAPTFPLAKK
ncbi:MAG TPA: heavy metal-responsive transcriptional regulator [Thermoanaerobaculia bacterium]|jgi:DNA-binding transcriptional MerR regulator|nr:heavy metal-responsive transcriptional regulator [Thermoanaerobaculia bacterium]